MPIIFCCKEREMVSKREVEEDCESGECNFIGCYWHKNNLGEKDE